MPRSLPQNIEAEQALLGTLIVYPQAINTCMDNSLSAADFFVENNQMIYQALSDLHNENKPGDFTSLLARLNDLNISEKIGGVDYLSMLSDSVVSGYGAQHYIDLIQEKALLRRLIYASQDIMKESFENSYDSDEVLDHAERTILAISHSRRASDFIEMSSVVNVVVDNITELSKNKGKPTGIRSGFSQLDKTTHGFQRGDLIILAARPSVGKTAFALNIAVNAASSQPLPIALFSLEMPAELLTRRILACRSGVDISKLRDAYLDDKEWQKLHEASSHVSNYPIYLDDSPTITMAEITAKCRKLQHDKGLAMVIIDYLQLISGAGRSENRQQEVSEISRRLKALARELNVPVIALSQLSRLIEQRSSNEKRVPRLSDLRESGAIEQDADIVMFLSYDSTNEEEENDDKNTFLRLDIAKHRNGQTRDFTFHFAKNVNLFAEVEYVADLKTK